MKEIKAFIHAHRVADVLQALKNAEATGIHIDNLAVFPVQALLHEPAAKESRYSIDLAETVVKEIKVEILCPDEAAVPLVELIKCTAHTSGHEEGWIVVTDTLATHSIGSGSARQP